VWCGAPDLFGMDVWGDSCRAILDRRARVVDHFTGSGGDPHRILIDNSMARDASPELFRVAAEFWGSRRERHAATIASIAVTVSNDYAGALLTGFTMLLDFGCPVRTFSKLDAALSWLGVSAANDFASELRKLRPNTYQNETVLKQLEGIFLERDLEMDLAVAARRLGMSPRTLQRRLSTYCTTFQQELLRAKLSRATLLMVAGRHSITAIASDLGFASLQHFSSRFSAVYGKPPSAWLRNYHAIHRGRLRDTPDV